MSAPHLPHIVVTFSSKIRAVRIRQLCENALRDDGVTKEEIARFKMDCLDHGTLVAAQLWVTVRIKS